MPIHHSSGITRHQQRLTWEEIPEEIQKLKSDQIYHKDSSSHTAPKTRLLHIPNENKNQARINNPTKGLRTNRCVR